MKEAIEKFLDDPKNKKRLIVGACGGLVVLVAVLVIHFATTSKVPRELYIDTLASPISERVKELKLDAPYYNKKVRHKTTDFYTLTKGKTKWLEFRKAKPNYITFVDAIKEGEKFGLNPDHYDLANIERDLVELYDNKQRTPEDVANLDIRITASFFLFTTHLIEGRIRTAGYGDFIWKKNIPKENDIKLLVENSSGKLSDIIEQLHSPHEQYHKLMKALQDYRELAEKSSFVKTTKSRINLKPGMKHSSVPSIRRRLFITDLENYSPQDSTLYDDEMLKGVVQFQERHGLVADGIINSATAKFLNQSFKEKADLIELNLERIRWLPTEYGADYISVNVPEYMLRVFENGKNKLEMRVVLGTEFNATPIFSDTLEYIVFSPTWNVPASILGEEMIPRLQENPEAYDPERFVFYHKGEEIDPLDVDWADPELDTSAYRIVERPGEENSLGLVKFIMPNNFNIYLHDTPAEKLFKKNDRAFSHGCIRLEKPVEFAKYLLRDNEKWDEKRIIEAMEGEKPVTVHLKKKYHVEIEYRTVWVDEKDKVHFREDIYGHDQRQLALLKRMDAMVDP